PIHRQGSYISTNVSPQSIRGFFFFVCTSWQGIAGQARKDEQRGRGALHGERVQWRINIKRGIPLHPKPKKRRL
ncbi:MAG: hypothetical protein ACRC9X_04735, partial [Bacteroidales bacterium]